MFREQPTAGGAAAGPTRIATYGDMGHSHYNNMGNLHDNCAAGRIDAILHMGDTPVSERGLFVLLLLCTINLTANPTANLTANPDRIRIPDGPVT